MLSEKNLLKQPEVQSLSLGQTVRLPHDCSVSGKSKNLSVTRNKDGFVYHCFKCGASGGTRAGVASVHKPIRTSRVYKIPSTATGEVSRWKRPVATWISKYLTAKEVLDHGLVSDDYELYVPISGGNFLIRNFSPVWEGPKWIKRGDSKYYFTRGSPSSTVAIVEDCISAICLASIDVDCIALLTTSIHNDAVAFIAKQGYTKAVVWLDDDNTVVRQAQCKIKSRLELVVPNVKIVHAGTDPKNLARTELWTYIW